MPKFEFCLPTLGKTVPSGKEWVHEIKYDGYRLRLEREDDRVRLITKGGYDWTGRFPWIVEAARRNRTRRFVIDGEAVVLCLDGIADFDALHSGKHNEEAQLCAFDVLAIDGDDLRELPLSMRKTNLERLLCGRPDGIFVNPRPSALLSKGTFAPLCPFKRYHRPRHAVGADGRETDRAPACKQGSVHASQKAYRATASRWGRIGARSNHARDHAAPNQDLCSWRIYLAPG
jgi:bifunctional non-homologous end joining protein LigD